MKKNRVKILLIAIIVPVLLTGCGVSPEQLAAKGIYPEEYRADSLAANIENAVLNGENKLETLYFGRISGLDPLYNEDWRRGYVCRRFVDGVSAEYEQYKGYLSAAYDIVLKDADLLAAMPRDGGELTIYRRTEDDAELCVMDMLQRGGKKALYLFESAASIQEFDKFIYDAIVGIQQKNYACEYLTDRISWVMTDYGDVTELELTVDYTEGAVPLGKMAEAVDKRSLYEAMVEAWSTDIEKEAAVLYTGASMTEGELLVSGDLGNGIYTEARGKVTAEVLHRFSYRADEMQDMLMPSGRKQTGFWIELKGKTIIPCVAPYEEYETGTAESFGFAAILPITLCRAEYSELVYKRAKADEEALKAAALRGAEELARAKLPKDAGIISKKTAYSSDEGGIICVMDIVAEQNITVIGDMISK